MSAARPTVLALGHRFASLEIETAVLDGLAGVVDANLLAGEALERALAEASVVMLGSRGRLDAPAVRGLPGCRAIVRYGIGVDNIAVAEATARGILVANVPEYCIQEVSDHTVALILAANRRLVAGNEAVRQGNWGPAVMAGTPRLATLTVGVVGFGRIGQEVARKLLPLVARVLAYDPYLPAEEIAAHGAAPAGLDELLGASDFVTINCPLTPASRHLLNAETLARMKPGAWLVNTARGEIVDEEALVEALQVGHLGGAALDVLTVEPPAPGARVARLPNVILTPHVAWVSTQATADLQRLAAEEARRVLEGQRPRWLVNPEAWAESGGQDS